MAITKIKNELTYERLLYVIKRFRQYSKTNFASDLKHSKYYNRMLHTAKSSKGVNVQKLLKDIGYKYRDKLSYKIVYENYLPKELITVVNFTDVDFVLDHFIGKKYDFLLLDPNIKFKLLQLTSNSRMRNNALAPGFIYSVRIVIPYKDYIFDPNIDN